MSDVPVDVPSDAPAETQVATDPAVEAAQAALAEAEQHAEAARPVTVQLLAPAGSTFASGVDGVPEITTYPIPVDAGSITAVKAAAARSTVRLIIEGEA